MNILYVFPGQGSQYEGMGKDICEAHDVAAQIYEQANAVLGYDIRDMGDSISDAQAGRKHYLLVGAPANPIGWSDSAIPTPSSRRSTMS